ncbi:serine hydrolase family protein [Candidatus Parcubacteria bacterium]|nr:MAG: serine hydrolase family protein [Candidatus Parcubacteria bacterium]
MKKIIIVHGWDGAADLDWMPWVTSEFKKFGYEVLCPDLPHSENPTIEDWVPFLSKIVGQPDQETYFIGHSIGCQTIMRYLESIDVKVGGAIFVAGWFDLDNLEGLKAQAIAKPWLEAPIDTEKVKNNLGFSITILGDNDPWVPYLKTKEKFEKLLGSEIVTVPNGGHITSDDGYGPFPQLIEIVHKRVSIIE